MSVSRDYIKECLYGGKNKGYSHMVMVCDSWDYTDFPVFVKETDNLETVLNQYRGANTLYSIMEIYNYEMDLEYQLNEHRAMHKTGENTIKKVEKKIERLEKLPGFKHSYEASKIKINNLGYIPFEQMDKLPNDMSGYIDIDGNFFPAISISSTNYSYGNLRNISMGQFGEAFVHGYGKDLDIYQQMISKSPKDRDILNAADDFIIHHLRFAKFYRYIDASEYGTTDELSRIPDDPSVKQLILLQQLFSINHNASTKIMEKNIQYSMKLAQKLRGDK